MQCDACSIINFITVYVHALVDVTGIGVQKSRNEVISSWLDSCFANFIFLRKSLRINNSYIDLFESLDQ